MTELPQIGRHYEYDGQTLTVKALKKRGKPPKDGGFGGQVVAAHGPGGDEIRVKFRDWRRGARAL